MTKRKFHRTVIQIEILSERIIEEVEYSDLDTVVCQITDGDWSGDIKFVSQTELDGKQAADALYEQRSDPSFFSLSPDGEDDADYDGDDNNPQTEQND